MDRGFDAAPEFHQQNVPKKHRRLNRTLFWISQNKTECTFSGESSSSSHKPGKNKQVTSLLPVGFFQLLKTSCTHSRWLRRTQPTAVKLFVCFCSVWGLQERIPLKMCTVFFCLIKKCYGSSIAERTQPAAGKILVCFCNVSGLNRR